MIEFKNIEKLVAFIEKYLKMKYSCYDLEAVKDEVFSAYCSGYNSYELGQFETVDGIPHTIDFTVTIKENDVIVIEF